MKTCRRALSDATVFVRFAETRLLYSYSVGNSSRGCVISAINIKINIININSVLYGTCTAQLGGSWLSGDVWNVCNY